MNLDIEKICPLHGPILNENLVHYIEKYNIWSSYKAESDGVYIACASIHGNTYSACEKLKEILEEKGISKVVLSNLSKENWSEAIENAFRYGKIVFASSTYNMEIFTPMRNLLLNLKEKNYQNKIVGLIENGTWAPNSAKCMKEILNTLKNIDIIEPVVTIKSKLSEENCLQLYKMAEDLIKNKKEVCTMKYKCTACGYIYDDNVEAVKFEDLPDDWVCPLCGLGKEFFEK